MRAENRCTLFLIPLEQNQRGVLRRSIGFSSCNIASSLVATPS
jgi:CelD/BcsL family acetyltransferase involved in cellulose biosynthesis